MSATRPEDERGSQEIAPQDAADRFIRVVEEAAADAGIKKNANDLDLPPWQKGRYGTAIGRAVHAVMQTIDLV